jgi:hypothetical protein
VSIHPFSEVLTRLQHARRDSQRKAQIGGDPWS